MKIKFCGAAKMVTGSNFLIESETANILIDCGMFQGNRLVENKNWEDFPYDPAAIDFLILTHGHIDHSGRIPKLVKEGFRGRIITTNASYDLSRIMLLDSAKIQESDLEWENKRRKRSGKEPGQALYTVEDAEESLKYFEAYFIDQIISLNENIKLRFKDAGHILGSAIVELWIREKSREEKLVFTGDLGVPGRPIIRDPDFIEEADYLIMESTYGDRLHETYEESHGQLMDIINRTALRGGSVIIPAFAVGRTQELIYRLNQYYEEEDLDQHMRLPIYVDSPMALEATRVFEANSSSFNEEARRLVLEGDNPFKFENLRYVASQQESMALNKADYPKVIISSSGMATAGRIRHHLKHNLWNEKNSLVFVGYQAEGTLGRILLDGTKKVKLLGEYIDVRLEIYNLEGFSGHGDRKDLLNWFSKIKKKPKAVFIVHGEEEASDQLKKSLKEEFGLEAIIPNMNDEYLLEARELELKKSDNIDPARLREDLEEELDRINIQYESLLRKKEELLDSKNLNKDYDLIKNNLIELQHNLMDLNIRAGK